MATDRKNPVAYGFSEPLITTPARPIIAARNPNSTDKASLGTLWINPTVGSAYVLVSIQDNIATWASFTGSSSSNIAFLAVLDTDIPAVLGDATTYLMGSTEVLNVISDDANTFYPGNGSGSPAVFTAPQSGLYEFTFGMGITDGGTLAFSTDCTLTISTTTTDYLYRAQVEGTGNAALSVFSDSYTIIAYMNTLDEAIFSVQANVTIPNLFTILGQYPTSTYTFISGSLIS